MKTILYFYSKLKNRLVVIINRILRSACSSIKIMTCDETIEFIIIHNVSLCRFGDGELFIMSGKHGIGFQEPDAQLAADLKMVINSKRDDLLICFPRWLFKDDSLA